jgi:hypothetical protein
VVGLALLSNKLVKDLCWEVIVILRNIWLFLIRVIVVKANGAFVARSSLANGQRFSHLSMHQACRHIPTTLTGSIFATLPHFLPLKLRH